MYKYLIVYSIIVLVSIVSSSNLTRCTKDSDCGTSGLCMEISLGRNTVKKCALNSASSPACGGSNFGNCPSSDSELGDLMCVFKKTNKIRNISCCKGGTSTKSPSTENTASSSSSASDTTGNQTTTAAPATNTSTTPARRLAETCMECFADPQQPNVTIAGEYICTPSSQCKSVSAFEDSCNTGSTCDTNDLTGGKHLCSSHGTCTPNDGDDPINSFHCLCQPGFSGIFCSQIASNSCMSDCGIGGDCTANKCVCKTGYTGKQCEGCLNNLVCNSAIKAGTCNLNTKKCECTPGYEGDSFCGTAGSSSSDVDLCDAITCGEKGQCLDGQCFCMNDCAGDTCTKCSTTTCKECSFGIMLSPSFLFIHSIGIISIFSHLFYFSF